MNKIKNSILPLLFVALISQSCGNSTGNAPHSCTLIGGAALGCGPLNLAGNATSIITSGFGGSPDSLTTDGTKLFIGVPAGSIFTTPLAGGTPSAIMSSVVDTEALTTDGTNLYIADGSSGNVYSAPLTGGSPSLLFHVSDSLFGITTDGKNLYATGYTNGIVYKYPIAGGTATSIVTGLTNPYGITTDGINLYIAERSANKIAQASVSGGPATVIVSGLALPEGITTDGTNLYFGGQNGGVFKVSVGGGTATTLVNTATIGNTGQITTDGIYVYVVNWSTNTVFKVQ